MAQVHGKLLSMFRITLRARSEAGNWPQHTSSAEDNSKVE